MELYKIKLLMPIKPMDRLQRYHIEQLVKIYKLVSRARNTHDPLLERMQAHLREKQLEYTRT